MSPYTIPHNLAMDFEGAHANVRVGQVDPGDSTNDAALNGTHRKIVTAASLSLPNVVTWPGGTKLLQLRLLAGEAPATTGRWISEVYGYDALETDFDVGQAQQHLAWHYDGQDYWYVLGLAQPSGFGWDAGNSRPNLIVKRDLLHQDTWIDGGVAVNGAAGGALHGHNAHGLLLVYNRPGLSQQFTPRPGDSFQPALSDTRPYWAFTGDHGDVTNADNIFTWALRLLNPDVTVWFVVRIKKRDFSGATGDTDPGRYQVWALTQAEVTAFGSAAAALASTPTIDYSGTTNPYGTSGDTSAFNPASPDSSEPGGPRWPLANQTPRYMRKRPRYTYAGMVYYTNPGLATLPANVGIYDTGTARLQTAADAFGILYATGSAPANTVLPVITGTLQTGYQQACSTGTWTGSPTFAYQWQQETALGSGLYVNVAANGAAAKYISPQALVGFKLRCAVTGHNAFGDVTVFTAPTTALAVGPLDPGVRDAESPLSQAGQWAGPIQSGATQPQITTDGIQSDGTAGHVCQSYRPDVSSADVGLIQRLAKVGNPNYAFTLWARIQNPGNATTMRAYLFSFVQGTGWRLFKCTGGSTFAQLGSTVATNTPTVDMLQKFTCVGTTLTGSVSTDAGANWTTILTLTDGTITGAGSIGIEIQDGASGAALKDFDQVAVNSGPTIVTAPAVSGSTGAGSILQVTNGVWANTPFDDSYRYQWTRDGADVTSATSSSYVSVQADVTHAVGCKVMATNQYGTGNAASSNTITVTAVAPFCLTAPLTTGASPVGTALSCDLGAWDFAPVSYARQWQKDGVDIGGQTAATYTSVGGDLTHQISCNVTATNAAGSTTVSSNAITVAVDIVPLNAKLNASPDTYAGTVY